MVYFTPTATRVTIRRSRIKGVLKTYFLLKLLFVVVSLSFVNVIISEYFIATTSAQPALTIFESNTNGGIDNEKRIRQIFEYAGVEITTELEALIPTWSEVKSLYGSKPKIIGLEKCDTFQNIIPVNDSYIGPSGLFNTGTNLLAKLLASYCILPSRTGEDSGMLWQVPWGKHNPIFFRLNHIASAEGSHHRNQTNVLPVVTIKDPYHWMGSMCRHPYAAVWDHSKERCPNLVPNQADVARRGMFLDPGPTKVTVNFQSFHKPHYASLVGLWNDWYGDYMAVDSFPLLIIRFEDLLFHAEEVITQVCHCADGEVKGGIHIMGESAKNHAGSNGLLSSILRYGHQDNRTDGMTKDDIDYAQQALNKDMMETFGYSHPRIDS